jgi:hypothetical protein
MYQTIEPYCAFIARSHFLPTECASSDFPGVYSKIAGNNGYSWIRGVVCDQWQETSSICGNAVPTPPPVPSPTPPAPTHPVPTPPAPTGSPTLAPVPNPTSSPVSSPVATTDCNPGEIFVEFEIDLDDYPDETSFEIYSSQGTVLMKGGPYSTSQSYSTVSASQCLPDTCLVLTMYDSFGDGLYGNYELRLDGNQIVSGDGDFEDAVNHFFNCDRMQDGACTPLVLDLDTDEYADETHFYLIDMTTQDFLWIEDQFSPYEVRQFTECLDPNRCYNLDVFDDYGDGITSGGIKITYDGTVVYEGGDIGYGEVFRFGC